MYVYIYIGFILIDCVSLRAGIWANAGVGIRANAWVGIRANTWVGIRGIPG